MKLSRTAAYSLRALCHLARSTNGSYVASHVIAGAEGVPELFLLKMFRPLVKAQVLLAATGQRGGYRLGRPDHRITLLEVIEAVDGPIQARVPSLEKDNQVTRKIALVFDRAANDLRTLLGRTTLRDLMEGRPPKRNGH